MPENISALQSKESVLSDFCAIRQELKVFGLTPKGYRILKLLVENGNMRIGDIGVSLNTSLATMTSAIDTLERRGWAARIRNTQDRRSVHVSIIRKDDFAKVQAYMTSAQGQQAS